MCELASEAVAGHDRVLEIAAGTGLVTDALARRARRVIATDYAPAMVSVLSERCKGPGMNDRADYAAISRGLSV
jgi:ubiquinone/menaquinone biosynthesis C-methylase UbiE